MDAVIAASKSVVSSDHLKKVLEVILAFGNYMNSSKRGGAFGFKLQSLDVVSVKVQTLVRGYESLCSADGHQSTF